MLKGGGIKGRFIVIDTKNKKHIFAVRQAFCIAMNKKLRLFQINSLTIKICDSTSRYKTLLLDELKTYFIHNVQFHILYICICYLFQFTVFLC